MITIWIFVCTFAVMDVPLKTGFSSEHWNFQQGNLGYQLTSKTSNTFYVFPREQCALHVKTQGEDK